MNISLMGVQGAISRKSKSFQTESSGSLNSRKQILFRHKPSSIQIIVRKNLIWQNKRIFISNLFKMLLKLKNLFLKSQRVPQVQISNFNFKNVKPRISKTSWIENLKNKRKRIMNEKHLIQVQQMFIRRLQQSFSDKDNKSLIWLNRLLTKLEMHLKQHKNFTDVERYLEKEHLGK